MLLMATPPAQSGPTASRRLAVVYSIVRGIKNAGEGPDGPCIVLSRFRHNEQIVWRIKVFDPATGVSLDNKALRSVEVNLPNKQTLTAKYGGHPWNDPKPTDYFWSTAWTVPANYPTGSLHYTITATANDGRTSTTIDFNVEASKLMILEGAVPKR
jgi:hypothetical protein